MLSITLKAQTASEITDLETPLLDESSGLLFYNNSLISFNDSGGEAELYEIDTVTGNVIRTVTINNATNVDWEDIAQDDDYIYIGDFGNNISGNRTDLKIYKVSKLDFDDTDDIATAEIINFYYENQYNFTYNIFSNFDAEGVISFGNHLLIFTKNWGDKKVNVYSIPKSPGTYSALLESSFNSAGMITGADISKDEKTIFLTGFGISQAAFMYIIHNLPNNSLDIFEGTISDKITNIVPSGNFIEAVSLFEKENNKFRLYLSNERFTANSGQTTVTYPSKLWLMEIEDESLNIQNEVVKLLIDVFPNPFEDKISINQFVDEIKIYDAFGKLMITRNNVDQVTITNLNSGVYIARIRVNHSFVTKRLVKR